MIVQISFAYSYNVLYLYRMLHFIPKKIQVLIQTKILAVSEIPRMKSLNTHE